MKKEENESVGICRNCEKCVLSSLGGDGINEPEYQGYFCIVFKELVEPVLPKHKVTSCEYYVPETNQ